VQLGADRRRASAATAAIGGWDAHEVVGPPASAVVSLSMLMKTAPTPRRTRRARPRNLRTEEGPQINGSGGHRRAAIALPSIAYPKSIWVKSNCRRKSTVELWFFGGGVLISLTRPSRPADATMAGGARDGPRAA
jgi:hypothetical protein